MKYRDVEYSIGDTGNARWRWKIHRKLEPGAMQPALFGAGDTEDAAIAEAKAVIDTILDAK